jgi:hypothetical protein
VGGCSEAARHSAAAWVIHHAAPPPRWSDADVLAGKAATFDAVSSMLHGVVSASLPLAEVARSNAAAPEVRAAAVRALEAKGAELTRLHNMLTVWNPDTYIESCCRRVHGGGGAHTAAAWRTDRWPCLRALVSLPPSSPLLTPASGSPRRYDVPGSVVGPGADAPLGHWERVVRATGLKREQARVFACGRRAGCGRRRRHSSHSQ